MSYCRWSSDDFQCDFYVWEDCAGGYRAVVASNRRTPDEPFPPFVSYEEEGFDAWWGRKKKVDAMLEACERKSIGLPHDGENFWLDTPGECADKLVELRSCGYNVPQYAIDALREEEVSDA